MSQLCNYPIVRLGLYKMLGPPPIQRRAYYLHSTGTLSGHRIDYAIMPILVIAARHVVAVPGANAATLAGHALDGVPDRHGRA